MKQIHGLDTVSRSHCGLLSPPVIANLLIDDLAGGYCEIYGDQDGQRILLTKLDLLPTTLAYDPFDRRLSWSVAGPILRNDCVPLTYKMQGKQFAITGRCSVIPKVCGVDLYLHRSYTGIIGDTVRQRFTVSTKELATLCKPL
ncbi:MAG: hypothetical protein KGZ80_04040 [Methylomonas sp.]|nr:hypothetical protein [Methylomonas sp.]PPD21791.1 MAG: hypothetical protein CTY23_04205 [Methylomonas sp.]PPD27477.1 MAG: hypothetical protein CTY22_01785 [Methylomonas sp.]PPD39460.1 MAG: hypothetical protein CTY21_01780 [Methylomonas sp.]PPD42260.1 MAG: hypothetical protein CTY17_01665 [Methylomonas sp.]